MALIEIALIVLVIIVIVLFVLLKSTKVPKSIYKSKAIYSDHKEKPVKALFSSKYGITGKPDFILHTKDGQVPLEMKHSVRPNQPYFSHVMQLISYCLLMEEEKGVKPKYGFIQYKSGKAFYVPYTEKMKEFLVNTIEEMRGYIDSGVAPEPVRNYKCDNCSCREECFPSSSSKWEKSFSSGFGT